MDVKKSLVSVAAAVTASLVVIAAIIAPNVSRTVPHGSDASDLPVFMYFVTNSDLEDKTVKGSLAQLEKDYAGLVEFDIRNVDKDPKLLSDFPVKDNTPALIMLDEKGDIISFLYKTSSYDKLKESIETVLNK
ncbi:MAG: hypothetical protein PUE13_04840 [Clostridiales bacterium]|nr:hypothetical protein [Clostridiales bacterium]